MPRLTFILFGPASLGFLSDELFHFHHFQAPLAGSSSSVSLGPNPLVFAEHVRFDRGVGGGGGHVFFDVAMAVSGLRHMTTIRINVGSSSNVVAAIARDLGMMPR